MKVMIREDMFANKIVAFYQRLERANRDIFDVWFFLHENWPINKALVEQRTEMPFKKFLGECINKLENFSERSILAGMGEVLSEKQKIWVKENLKKDLLFLLKLKLSEQTEQR